jgi:DICT domain-containing protein
MHRSSQQLVPNVERKCRKRKRRIRTNAPTASTQRVPATFDTLSPSSKAIGSYYDVLALSPTQKKDWMSKTSRDLVDSHLLLVFERLIQDQLKKDTSLRGLDPLELNSRVYGIPDFLSSLKREIAAVVDRIPTYNPSTAIEKGDFTAFRKRTSGRKLNQMVMTCT